VDVGDLGMTAELVGDLGQHPLLVVDAWSNGRLLRQVVGDVAVDQILNGGRGPPCSFIAGGIDTLVDLLA